VEHARGCDEFPTSSAAADRGFSFEEIRNESESLRSMIRNESRSSWADA